MMAYVLYYGGFALSAVFFIMAVVAFAFFDVPSMLLHFKRTDTKENKDKPEDKDFAAKDTLPSKQGEQVEKEDSALHNHPKTDDKKLVVLDRLDMIAYGKKINYLKKQKKQNQNITDDNSSKKYLSVVQLDSAE